MAPARRTSRSLRGVGRFPVVSPGLEAVIKSVYHHPAFNFAKACETSRSHPGRKRDDEKPQAQAARAATQGRAVCISGSGCRHGDSPEPARRLGAGGADARRHRGGGKRGNHHHRRGTGGDGLRGGTVAPRPARRAFAGADFRHLRGDAGQPHGHPVATCAGAPVADERQQRRDRTAGRCPEGTEPDFRRPTGTNAEEPRHDPGELPAANPRGAAGHQGRQRRGAVASYHPRQRVAGGLRGAAGKLPHSPALRR